MVKRKYFITFSGASKETLPSQLSMLTLVPAEIILNADMVDTKVARFLDAHGVPCRVSQQAEPDFTVETPATQRGVVLEEMVKSVLSREWRRHRFVMACVPGRDRLDPKAVRAYFSWEWKRFSFATA